MTGASDAVPQPLRSLAQAAQCPLGGAPSALCSKAAPRGSSPRRGRDEGGGTRRGHGAEARGPAASPARPRTRHGHSAQGPSGLSGGGRCHGGLG
jgi:hypothetical protein